MSAAALASPRQQLAWLAPARAAAQGFINQTRWWAWALGALLYVGVPLLLQALIGGKIGLVSFSIMLLWSAFGLWGLLTHSVFLQNHPTLARLMPGHVMRLRLTLLLPYFAGTLVSEQLGRTLWDMHGLGTVAVAAFCFVALGARWPLVWASTAVLGFTPLVNRILPAPLVALLQDGVMFLASLPGLLLATVAGAILLGSLVQAGGPAHESSYLKAQARRRSSRSGNATSELGWANRMCSNAYARSFAATLAGRRDRFDRIALALGPKAHRSSTGAGIFVMVIIVLIVIVSLRFTGVFELSDKAAQGVGNSLFGLMGVLIGVVTQLHGTMVQRRHEQAVVSLLPGVPRGTAFNRALGLWLMGQYLRLWGMGAGLLTLILAWLPGTHMALLAFLTGTLPGGLMLWRDWSRANRFSAWDGLAMALPIALTVLSRWALEGGRLSVPVFLALAVVVIGVLAAWRWRVMTRAPMAWPAGRH